MGVDPLTPDPFPGGRGEKEAKLDIAGDNVAGYIQFRIYFNAASISLWMRLIMLAGS